MAETTGTIASRIERLFGSEREDLTRWMRVRRDVTKLRRKNGLTAGVRR